MHIGGWERILGIRERVTPESDGTPRPKHPEAGAVSADESCRLKRQWRLPLSVSPDDVEAAARSELEDLVASIVAEADGHPEVHRLVVPGDPREQLETAVAGTDLLVVGARGHGVIHRLLLGSVAMALVHHPTLPTIVVPRERA